MSTTALSVLVLHASVWIEPARIPNLDLARGSAVPSWAWWQGFGLYKMLFAAAGYWLLFQPSPNNVVPPESRNPCEGDLHHRRRLLHQRAWRDCPWQTPENQDGESLQDAFPPDLDECVSRLRDDGQCADRVQTMSTSLSGGWRGPWTDTISTPSVYRSPVSQSTTASVSLPPSQYVNLNTDREKIVRTLRFRSP